MQTCPKVGSGFPTRCARKLPELFPIVDGVRKRLRGWNAAPLLQHTYFVHTRPRGIPPDTRRCTRGPRLCMCLRWDKLIHGSYWWQHNLPLWKEHSGCAFYLAQKFYVGFQKKVKIWKFLSSGFVLLLFLLFLLLFLLFLGVLGVFFSLRLIRKDLAFSSVLRREHRRDNLFW